MDIYMSLRNTIIMILGLLLALYIASAGISILFSGNPKALVGLALGCIGAVILNYLYDKEED